MLLRDFHAEATDAHRLCTMEHGWVECFGQDVLISFSADSGATSHRAAILGKLRWISPAPGFREVRSAKKPAARTTASGMRGSC